jgi:hypothetical protein
MSRKALSVIVFISLAALTACSDITSPETPGFCQINGGPGTCAGVSK